jgi:(p)ppGpp synthase/HD superfamily hydrolase
MLLSWDQDTYLSAFRFAAEAHRGQYVPGTADLPYITHISCVCMEVIAALQAESGLDGNFALQCALLHDVLEDTDVTFDRIRTQFGEKTAWGVEALSKNAELDKSVQMVDSLGRIQRQPREIWMVKMADRITNLQSPPREWSQLKIENYYQEAIEIHRTLSPASLFLASRLAKKIEKYKEFLLHPNR